VTRAVTADVLTEQLALADELLAGRGTMNEPQDLPGRYGRVIRALDHLLKAVKCPSVLGGGWAVWRHGFLGRVTQDIDIVLPADAIDEFLRTAAVSGFDVLPRQPGRWPKLMHRDTGVQVDILPEGERPGTPASPAPTTLPHPISLGGGNDRLRYVSLPGLIELKLAAGRARDEADVVELLRANPDQVDAVRGHLATVHANYVVAFDHLLARAREQQDE
jgi:hypothetical protein